MSIRILTVLGARPQFIKASPVCDAFTENGIEELIIHTGQHYDEMMSDTFFKEMDIPKPFANLNVGSKSPATQVANIILKLDPIIENLKPDLVLVYGDTNSTLAGALAGCKREIPVVHIESGLRSRNKSMPEEHNRILTDHCSDILFCPTSSAVRNLKIEGLTTHVSLVGDTMYDTVRLFSARAEETSQVLYKFNLARQEYVLTTLHRGYNTDNHSRLSKIFSSMSKCGKSFILPMHPRLKEKISRFAIDIPNNVNLVEPVGYLDMLMLQKNSTAIVTDSGGIQKEAYFLQKPCITLRPETEWIETLEGGWNRLCWHEIDKLSLIIKNAVSENFGEQRPHFGDGYASGRIVDVIKQQFENVKK